MNVGWRYSRMTSWNSGIKKIQACGCLKGPGKDHQGFFSELLLIHRGWSKHMVLLVKTSHLWAWTRAWSWWVNRDLQLQGRESPQAGLAVICQSSFCIHFHPFNWLDHWVHFLLGGRTQMSVLKNFFGESYANFCVGTVVPLTESTPVWVFTEPEEERHGDSIHRLAGLGALKMCDNWVS